MLDVNCDGINDIIVGEPLSTSVGLISANGVDGNAGIFLGKADGTYNITPYWSLENSTSFDFGINADSLIGYSVAGAGHVREPLQGCMDLLLTMMGWAMHMHDFSNCGVIAKHLCKSGNLRVSKIQKDESNSNYRCTEVIHWYGCSQKKLDSTF